VLYATVGIIKVLANAQQCFDGEFLKLNHGDVTNRPILDNS
jgi:hypothetical protein